MLVHFPIRMIIGIRIYGVLVAPRAVGLIDRLTRIRSERPVLICLAEFQLQSAARRRDAGGCEMGLGAEAEQLERTRRDVT